MSPDLNIRGHRKPSEEIFLINNSVSEHDVISVKEENIRLFPRAERVSVHSLT